MGQDTQGTARVDDDKERRMLLQVIQPLDGKSVSLRRKKSVESLLYEEANKIPVMPPFFY